MIKRKSNKIVKISADKDFRKWIKIEAAKKGVSMLEFQRMIALKKLDDTFKEDKNKFDFKL